MHYEPPHPVARRQTVRKAACELRTEEDEVLLSGTFERCASDVVKRCKGLAKGAGGAYGHGATAASFAWTIVGPDGAVRTRHAIMVLS